MSQAEREVLAKGYWLLLLCSCCGTCGHDRCSCLSSGLLFFSLFTQEKIAAYVQTKSKHKQYIVHSPGPFLGTMGKYDWKTSKTARNLTQSPILGHEETWHQAPSWRLPRRPTLEAELPWRAILSTTWEGQLWRLTLEVEPMEAERSEVEPEEVSPLWRPTS